MTLQQLKYIEAVARCKNISKAAEEVFISQPSLTASFAINAMVDVIKEFGGDKYNFTLRETQTFEIIEDVSRLKSELGILYKSSKNEEVINKLLKKYDLEFVEIFNTSLYVFISNKNPLAKKEKVTVKDLADFPYLIYEQGEHNSFYFAEEPYPAIDINKTILVRDRATLFNLLIGLNGYTVSSGVISRELNGKSIISVPFDYDEYMSIGYIAKKGTALSRYGTKYIEFLKRHVNISK